MSRPLAGTYHIVNNVPGPGEVSLAITDNGEGNPLTVTTLDTTTTQPSQLWSIKNYDEATQTVVPGAPSDPELQVAFNEGSSLTVRPAVQYVWAITGKDELYTFQDDGYIFYWSLREGKEGENVFIGAQPSNDRQHWRLITRS